MLRITVRVRGADGLRSRFKRLDNRLPSILEEEVEAEADRIAERIVASIQKPYPPASRPGEPPHKRTGHLAGSVSVVGSGATRNVGYGAHYGDYLEHGTSKMAARPSIAPAIEGSEAALAAGIAARIRSEL